MNREKEAYVSRVIERSLATKLTADWRSYVSYFEECNPADLAWALVVLLQQNNN